LKQSERSFDIQGRPGLYRLASLLFEFAVRGVTVTGTLRPKGISKYLEGRADTTRADVIDEVIAARRNVSGFGE
jgi:hypothetical protein